MSRPERCPDPCNVLLIGGGGREHALAWRLRQSSRLGRLWVTHPGNGGLAGLGDPCPHQWQLGAGNIFHFARWCDRNDIHLVVVGPEAPLAEGIVDALEQDGRRVFGPSRAAAAIEADKWFAKELMRQAAIPTAEARHFDSAEFARQHIVARNEPCVIKATGLAAGKGVVVCDTPEAGVDAVDRILVQHEFGAAGASIMVEDKLSGQELSVLALVDGRTIWVLDPCQDHKQRDEGDQGPNTGGMGAYCPTPLADDETIATVQREIIVPAVDALRRDGILYRGVLYTGLMLTPAGPKVLEFNCRFGDPECQPLMARLQGDLVHILWATASGTLDQVDEIRFDDRVACCVVMCSAGYPDHYEKGKPITGIAEAEALGHDARQVTVFHAGTTLDTDGTLRTSGGRVLGVTALAEDLQAARDLANAACEVIQFEGAFFRRDIGDRILVRS